MPATAADDILGTVDRCRRVTTPTADGEGREGEERAMSMGEVWRHLTLEEQRFREEARLAVRRWTDKWWVSSSWAAPDCWCRC
jgi:hypothetical protein